MKSKMSDDDMDYMDWSYKICQDKKKKESLPLSKYGNGY